MSYEKCYFILNKCIVVLKNPKAIFSKVLIFEMQIIWKILKLINHSPYKYYTKHFTSITPFNNHLNEKLLFIKGDSDPLRNTR